MIHCIMVSGMPLDEMVSDALWRTAWNMFHSNKGEQLLVTDFCKGIVRSEFKNILLVGIGGIEFEGDIATDKGSTKVIFIVSHSELESEHRSPGKWIPLKFTSRPKKEDPSKRFYKNSQN